MARIVALCGGVGGAKLAFGLSRILPSDSLTLLVNTGDDFEHLGLPICPDIDTVTYTLAGLENPEFGWGRADETWSVLEELRRVGGEAWFRLGDKDIAHHLSRLALLRGGATLTEATAALTRRLGVETLVLPATNDRLRTIVETAEGALAFQDDFVARRCEPVVTGFHFEGAETARLSPAALVALGAPDLSGIIICPSNPYVSIGPMLALRELRARLEKREVPVLAVSPIVGGQALKGPAGKMMKELGHDVSVLSVADFYKGLIDALVIDPADEEVGELIALKSMSCFITPSIMHTKDDRVTLARRCLDYLELI